MINGFRELTGYLHTYEPYWLSRIFPISMKIYDSPLNIIHTAKYINIKTFILSNQSLLNQNRVFDA